MGHSDAELERLVWQSDVLRPYTERLLEMARIQRGMRVLDVGCGAGDVTLMLARMVGPTGSVTGIDRSGRPLALARRRADSAGLRWIEFRQAPLADFAAAERFDAVVGRYVLFHQLDPVGFLRDAARHAGPGGVLAFHEMNVARPAPTVPEVPLWRQADEWAKLALNCVAPHADAGSRLIEHFDAAGLREPLLRCEVPVGGGPRSPLYKYMADTIRSLLPVLHDLGVSEDAVEIDTLEDRLRRAVVAARAQIEWNPQFLAVARK
jgi:ubiquinone/menaquinone biosynthesis C-methylase UbiE